MVASSLPGRMGVQAPCMASDCCHDVVREKGSLLLPRSLLGLLWHHPGWLEAFLLQPDEGGKLGSLYWAFTVRGMGGKICSWGSVDWYIRVLKRNRSIECVHMVYTCICACVCMYQREIDLGNRLTVDGGCSEVCRVDWQTEDLGKNWCHSSSPKAVWRQNSLFLVGRRGWENTCISIKVINWLCEAHPHYEG